EAGNLILCTAAEGDRPSYESEDLKHGIFTAAWLEVLRGELPPNLRGLYDETSRGLVVTLSSLQALIDRRVRDLAREAGVRQAIQFPQELMASFSSSQPIFMPVPPVGPR